ncbi:hypothetical protein EO244_08930 [Ancylomarina salipaludis]|uniref:Outer membrane protein beta-barrel domain-containing protein n=1 Tax=Ancylomarina salipaludis TaxID=2501299 RepID=A0A4Q1JL02_9BACT|nr:hypothetical protein [Ancylomarina salipaludis]RXQ94397.1 hypothetical protein EO244_08930 [Ancylomarina salipaludis]
MLNKNGHIDKLFSEGLKDLSVQPRPELWTRIQTDMKSERRKKRAAVIFITLAAAASFALLFTLANGVLFQQNTEIQDQNVFSEMNNTPVVRKEKSELKFTNTIGKQLIGGGTTPIRKLNSQTKQSFSSDDHFSENKNVEREVSLQMILPKSQIHALDNLELNQQLSEKSVTKKEVSLSLFPNDSLIIAHNIKVLEQFNNAESKKKEWSILGQLSSAYSSYSGDKSGNNSEQGLLSIGGGVKLNWQTGKKLAIQTGIIYNKFGQQLAGSNQVLHSVAFNSGLTIQTDAVSDMKTSAGKIKKKGSPMLADSNEFAAKSSRSTPDMVQSFEAIEIPFVLSYSLIDRKFGLHLNGGLSTNLMIGNRVYNKNTRETIGETDGIRTTNFSTSFSLGMEYQLNSKFSLSMEPSLKYYLNSINKDSDFNYKPYSIGLSSGIRYKF